MEKKLIGQISHYYGKLGVAVVDLTDIMKVGDKISIEGPSTNLEQVVDSLQIEHKNVQAAKKGQSIGMKVAGTVREKDNVYRVVG